MSQIKTKRTTTKSILSRTMFAKGIRDALAGLGFDTGYEDLSDHDQLRQDPLLAVLSP